jgi:hypothetical protein
MRKGSRSITQESSRGEPSDGSCPPARDPLVELEFPAVPASVPRARALVSDAARAHVSRESLELVRQALTEVMTHAMRLGRARSKVSVSVTVDDAVYVQVTCSRTRFSPRRSPPPDLGLYIVGALTDRWGVQTGSTTRVWFSVPRWPDG